ncbi:hypothetical protein D3C87_721060 [compost metagenome]
MLDIESWNSCAEPWKAYETPSGSSSSAASRTMRVATSRVTPGAASKDNVTAGSCPTWLTVTGPTPVFWVVTADNGTSLPEDERT